MKCSFKLTVLDNVRLTQRHTLVMLSADIGLDYLTDYLLS